MSLIMLFFFKQKTAYEMRISDWSSDVCSSDLLLEQTLKVFARLGVKLVEMTPPDMEAVTAAANVIISGEASALHANWLRTRPTLHSDQARARPENGLALRAIAHTHAPRRRWQATAR